MERDDTIAPAASPSFATEDTHHAFGTMPAASGMPTALETGAKVGRYIVLEAIGAGGMGVVYAAFDPELDRKVALKLLRPDSGWLDQGGAGARLLREAQAMARLSHPNVITVHDVGTYGDQIFVAMEFVDGVTLRQWLAASARGWREVLEVYRRAGDGLAAAHAAGLIHRDFKPDNVLISRDGRVRVLDFGLARSESAPDSDPAVAATAAPGWDETSHGVRRTIETPLTMTGAFMGTPAYMAPEQHLRRPTDARTDQFSFCVAIYEALYGDRPFAGKTPAALAYEVIKGQIPEAPEDTRVPEWVRRIVVRGLSVNPSHRHPSMAALLDALSRDPSVARRRILSVVAFAGVAAAGIVAAAMMREAKAAPCQGGGAKVAGVWNDERRGAIRAAFQATRKAYAGDAVRGVFASFDDYASKWAAMRKDACEATRVRGEQSEELLDLKMLCLDKRLAELAALTTVFAKADTKVVRNAVRAADELSSLDECQSAEALRTSVRPPADPAARAKLAAIHDDVARAKALLAAGKYKEGLDVARRASAASQELNFRPAQAEALYYRGALESKSGQFANAERSLFAAWTAAQAGRDDRRAAEAASWLVSTLGSRQARFPEARRWAEIAAATLERLGGNEELEGTYAMRRGLFAHKLAKLDEAIRYHGRSVAIAEKLYGEESARLAARLSNLGASYYRKAQLDDALKQFRRALAIAEKTLGPDHPNTGRYVNNVGLVLADQGDYEGALALHQRALAVREKVHGPKHPAVAESHNNLGIAYKELRRLEPSRRHYERALEIFRGAGGADSQDVARVHNNLGNMLETAKRYDDARKHLAEAMRIWTKLHGEDHPEVATVIQNQGAVFQAEGRFDEALEHFRRALRLREKLLGKSHIEVSEPLLTMGEVLVEKRLPFAAIESLERAVRLLEAGKAFPLVLARTRFALARALHLARKTPERVVQLLEQALLAYQRARNAGEAARVGAFLARIAKK
jgi:tetratricopeptide (TPR) repeat protein